MIIEVKNLNFSYIKGGRQILKDINLSLKEGEIMSILGPNGAGKSTLLNCIGTLLIPDSGTISLCGKDAEKMKPKEVASILSYVPQTHIPAFSYSVFNFVLMGRAPKIGMFEKPKVEDIVAVEEVLKEVGLIELADKPYTEISGGERQQVIIARALVSEPKVILFDEPTAHLDYGNQIKILRVIKNLAEKGYAIVITTHNPDQAIMLGGTVAILSKEGRVEIGPVKEKITEETLKKLYDTELKLIQLEEVKRPVCVPPNL
ncbi:MAG: ABC transporter ATP-binding protein [Ruminococcaceae bacterium]|jgi:iron complex transport system ATP-binding protein|nr:ABC transporter ATP-binding protein [Oscillospiraceae bacterium]